MALQLDLFGVRGLISHVQANTPKEAPGIPELQQQLDQYEQSGRRSSASLSRLTWQGRNWT